mmetsp:Transcript_9377/g.39810  ORF Transcript_9377/g.39810 Transcript_9377/m.39810 type:complete len:473 (+) Transcript_9377:876-2294(+)
MNAPRRRRRFPSRDVVFLLPALELDLRLFLVLLRLRERLLGEGLRCRFGIGRRLLLLRHGNRLAVFLHPLDVLRLHVSYVRVFQTPLRLHLGFRLLRGAVVRTLLLLVGHQTGNLRVDVRVIPGELVKLAHADGFLHLKRYGAVREGVARRQRSRGVRGNRARLDHLLLGRGDGERVPLLRLRLCHLLLQKNLLLLALAQPPSLALRLLLGVGPRHALLLHQPLGFLLLRRAPLLVQLHHLLRVLELALLLLQPHSLAVRLRHRIRGAQALVVVEPTRLLHLSLPLALFDRRALHLRLGGDGLLRGHLLRRRLGDHVRLCAFHVLVLRAGRAVLAVIVGEELVPAKRGGHGLRRRVGALLRGLRSVLALPLGALERPPAVLLLARRARLRELLARRHLSAVHFGVQHTLRLELLQVLGVLARPLRLEELLGPLDLGARLQLRVPLRGRPVPEQVEIRAVRLVDLELHGVRHE